jgi:uracil-DNA glycosylase
MHTNIEPSWKKVLHAEFKKPYFVELSKAVGGKYLNQTIYPTVDNIFRAFSLCPFNKVKVVIIGQDPYHGAGQAHGLAFSVLDGVKIPPSLRNIYKEIKSDIGVVADETGNLEHWAKQGVLLLNTTLTVTDGQPASHFGIGWEIFTDAVIKTISEQKENIVFILWGKHAQAKVNLIDTEKHLVLESSHPSPFSAHRGFLGCRHFSQTNEYLNEHSLPPINW